MSDLKLKAVLQRLNLRHPAVQRLTVAELFQHLDSQIALSSAAGAEALQTCLGHQDEVIASEEPEGAGCRAVHIHCALGWMPY